MAFKPERFLPTNGRTAEVDPSMFAFGFGRRSCPGKLLANTSIYLTIAQSLAVFEIEREKNDIDVQPEFRFLPGLISHPAPFATSITPRSSKHEQLIRSVETEHPWERSDAEQLNAIEVDH